MGTVVGAEGSTKGDRPRVWAGRTSRAETVYSEIYGTVDCKPRARANVIDRSPRSAGAAARIIPIG